MKLLFWREELLMEETNIVASIQIATTQKSKKGTISLIISITMRSSTLVLLKKENISKHLIPWKRTSRDRNALYKS